MAYFFFSFSSFFLTRFCSSSRCSPKFPPLQAAGTNFEKIGEKAWNFSSFLVQEPDLEPRNLSPLLEKPDLPCSASSPPAALALWGRIGLVFLVRNSHESPFSCLNCPGFMLIALISSNFYKTREFSLQLAAGLLPPAMSGFCSCKLWFPIILSVSA
ncbi:hypothetical protein SLEP1_g27686 [Rubroshorea leprosula]|uniref:Uncharacterized protein n=1 Tax=Rubroshorea leprosula TaxID=152421 RepID=A0AAV5JZX4_9ROSI|nr:hypothetical protein SLEP1_g27686 [Rubroshorea leprosula]